jgi:hypothetical protein
MVAGRTVGAGYGLPRPYARASLAGCWRYGCRRRHRSGAGEGWPAYTGYLNPHRNTNGDVDNMIDAAISGAVTAPLLGGHSHALDAAKAISAQVRAFAPVSSQKPGLTVEPPPGPDTATGQHTA